ncbi:MAG: hypothetical protein U5N58_09620 [Actinomycetota bacterium]|nr:hypothetical protein [Actinomycetota bacterium]
MFPEIQVNQELTSIPEVEIDERELAIIENIDENMETNYQAQKESVVNPDVADPFKPYYTQQAQEQENTIRLDQIYSQDGVEYAEVKFNEFDYKLTETDVFAEVYQVQAINENSVVLLKGDEIITLILGQLLYD